MFKHFLVHKNVEESHQLRNEVNRAIFMNLMVINPSVQINLDILYTTASGDEEVSSSLLIGRLKPANSVKCLSVLVHITSVQCKIILQLAFYLVYYVRTYIIQ